MDYDDGQVARGIPARRAAAKGPGRDSVRQLAEVRSAPEAAYAVLWIDSCVCVRCRRSSNRAAHGTAATALTTRTPQRTAPNPYPPG